MEVRAKEEVTVDDMKGGEVSPVGALTVWVAVVELLGKTEDVWALGELEVITVQC